MENYDKKTEKRIYEFLEYMMSVTPTNITRQPMEGRFKPPEVNQSMLESHYKIIGMVEGVADIKDEIISDCEDWFSKLFHSLQNAKGSNEKVFYINTISKVTDCIMWLDGTHHDLTFEMK